MLRSREISTGWRVCREDWLDPPGYLAFGKLDWVAARVPGHVHDDLVAAGVIGDPFFGLQELGCQWVDQAVWVYETEFDFTCNNALTQRVLYFEGLDTVCIVHLNGAQIAAHDNMFVPLEVDVGQLLREGSNTLRVTFFPALSEATERRAKYFATQGLPSDLVRFEERAFVRKASYMFGWDWGPRLVSAGIWKPVRLIEFEARIGNVEVLRTYEASGRVKLRCHTEIVGEGHVIHVLSGVRNEPIMFVDAAEIVLDEPELWWPRGLGEAHLYTLTTHLLEVTSSDAPRNEDQPNEPDFTRANDVRTTKIGLRRLELVREADAWGESFYFRVNGVRVWSVGANWIPDHSYPSTVTRAQLAAQLERVVDMNMNMLRVWGGGVYESDDFYDLCDELGVLVWQDFPFACSYSPDDAAAIAVIEAEARVCVKRLRHHPSLALWCGNNENQMMFEAKWDDPQKHPGRCFGERIWEMALPNLLATLDPDRPYISTSPHSPGAINKLANADECGDQHNWDVWHGRGDWVHYKESRARFASEYGFAAAPTHDAWDRVFPPGWELLPVDHPVARWHDKTKKGDATFRQFIELHYAPASNLEEWTYLSQLNQRDALRAAVEHYRRSPFCSGSLIWQLNDCWPVQSWSVLDSEGGYKAAAFELRRLYAPFLVSAELTRATDTSPVTGARIWIALHNSRSVHETDLQVQVRDSRDGWLVSEVGVRARIEPGQSMVLFEVDTSEYDPTTTVLWLIYETVVLHVLLCEPKDLQTAPVRFTAVRRGHELLLAATGPALDVFVRPSAGARVARNFLNFAAAGSVKIELSGECSAVTVRWLSGVVTIPVTKAA